MNVLMWYMEEGEARRTQVVHEVVLILLRRGWYMVPRSNVITSPSDSEAIAQVYLCGGSILH